MVRERRKTLNCTIRARDTQALLTSRCLEMTAASAGVVAMGGWKTAAAEGVKAAALMNFLQAKKEARLRQVVKQQQLQLGKEEVSAPDVSTVLRGYEMFRALIRTRSPRKSPPAQSPAHQLQSPLPVPLQLFLSPPQATPDRTDVTSEDAPHPQKKVEMFLNGEELKEARRKLKNEQKRVRRQKAARG
jgi:hypothetical protein